MIKFIKENWLIAVISGATGSLIMLLIIYIFHLKIWNSDVTVSDIVGAIGSILSGVGTIALVILGFKAKDKYIEQKLIDYKFESIKKISGILFFYKSNIFLAEKRLNTVLSSVLKLDFKYKCPELIVNNLQKYFNELKDIVNQFKSDLDNQIIQQVMATELLGNNLKFDILMENIDNSMLHMIYVGQFIDDLPLHHYWIIEEYIPKPLEVNIASDILALYNVVEEAFKSMLPK